ncbi:MAG: hypothetical protein AB7S26_27710 [Sandaracinaceae bacterium]
MSIPHHLVSAKIAEARARGAFRGPLSDEARLLSEMEQLLAALAGAAPDDALEMRARLALCERRLAEVLERTGQSVLADALYDRNPEYDA